MQKNFALLAGLMVFMLSCQGEQDEAADGPRRGFPEIEKSKLLVIHHDQEGRLIHYLSVKKISDKMLIAVKPTKDQEDLYVTVLGTKRHDLLKRSFSMSSQVGEGKLGKIEVIVEHGKAVSVNGNRLESPALVSEETLASINERLAAGEEKSEGASTIVIMEASAE